MRKFGLSIMLCSFAAVPCAALAQETSNPEDYVCALSGECAEEEQDEAQADQPGGSPRVSATRGFSLSTSGSTPPRATQRRPRQNTTRPAPRRPQVATAQPGRVNIRVTFGTGSAALSSAAQAEVRAFAAALQRPQLANMRFQIEGHTDSTGSRATNVSLSQRRAQAVADYLVRQGVSSSRLEVRGYGPDRPLPGRPSSSGDNRRVEAVRINS